MEFILVYCSFPFHIWYEHKTFVYKGACFLCLAASRLGQGFEKQEFCSLGLSDMGKPAIKSKKKKLIGKSSDSSLKNGRIVDHSQKMFDEDTTIFTELAQDIKEEGNKLYQKRDYRGAILKYEKAIKLYSKDHVDVPLLRSNIATCYMQMTPKDYQRAINECNLALEVSPKYTRAILKRAKCFEGLNQFESAYRDVALVLSLEPKNNSALETSERIKQVLETKGITLEDIQVSVPPKEVHVLEDKLVKEKHKKKKVKKLGKKIGVEEKRSKENEKKKEPMRSLKLVFGDDIRCAQIQANITISQLREIVRNRFPSLRAVLIKYKDREGDLVTIATLEDLKQAQELGDPQGSIRLYVVEASPDHEPSCYEENSEVKSNNLSENESMKFEEDSVSSPCIDSWIVQFAQLLKSHLGFSSDECIDLHELGMKLYSEAMEDTFASEEAHEIFSCSEDKFQEMAALALFNWGNVHMYRVRKKLFVQEDASDESIFEQVKLSYEWAKGEYAKAETRYENALKIKPDFYEAIFALGYEQFEQAKLTWYYALGTKVDLHTWPSNEVLELFNNAEDNMERGMEIWEEMEEKRLKNLLKPDKEKVILEKTGLDAYIKDVSNDEAAEQASNMRSQINLLWGALLYERSVVEFKLGLPVWEDCLMAAVDKFKEAGASPTDLAVMIKNHIANETTQEGLGFKIDEMVQAWHEMHDAKKWIRGIRSYRLEPLFKRRAPKLHHVLEHM